MTDETEQTTIDEGPDSRGEWLDKELDRLDKLGKFNGTTTEPQIRALIAPRMRLADIEAWSGPGLAQAINRRLKDRGIVKNHADKTPGVRAVPVKTLTLFSEDEIVTFVGVRHAQAEADRKATRADVEEWKSAHPESKLTVDKIMRRGGWDKAEAAS